MTPESSPFTPGQPVPIEFFVGRIGEVAHLRSLVKASVRGKFKIGFVTGERGIGKSSLASFVRHLGEREDSIAGAHVFLGGATGLQDMVRRSFDRILKESIDKAWYDSVRKFFGDHVRRVGLFGASVELSINAEDLGSLVHDFVPSLRRLVSQLREDRKALLLILDDINGLADSQEFANWLKSTVDQIATEESQPLPVCILIVGLEERRQSLIKAQPSLARVFDLVEIRPWSDQETAEFYSNAFAQTAIVTPEASALKSMVRFTGGLPVIAHEIGDAVWRVVEGETISEHVATIGIFNAAEIIGRKLLEPQVFRAIRSKRYRSILRKLAEDPFTLSFARAGLRRRLTQDEVKVLDNFLTRMRKLGAIVTDTEAGPGSYRFTNQLHRLYFWLEVHRAKKKNVIQDDDED